MNILSMIVLVSLMTFALRALPFLLFSGKHQLPLFVAQLQKQLPSAVMILLVIYCVKGIHFEQINGWMPYFAGVLATVLAHWKKKNVLLSMLAGTFVYMLLC